MTVTVQKEVADRIVAHPGTKDYGALSVWIESQCRVEMVRVLPPSVFWPRPRVTSAVIHVEVDPALRGRIHELTFFHDFIRSLFFDHVLLRGVLYSAVKDRLDKPAIDSILATCGLAPMPRRSARRADDPESRPNRRRNAPRRVSFFRSVEAPVRCKSRSPRFNHVSSTRLGQAPEAWALCTRFANSPASVVFCVD